MSQKQQAKVRGRSNKVMIFTCALALVAAVIVGLIINNATAGSRFENEVVAINDAFSSGDDQKIEEVLKRTVSSGNYAKVETSLKSYVGDLSSNINQIDEIADNETVYSALDGDYLEKNIDKLDEIIATLTDISSKVEVLTTNAKKLYNKEDVKNYIQDKNLGEGFQTLFFDNAKLFYDDKDLHENYDSTLKLLRGSVLVEIEAVTYLKDHRSDWEVKDKKVVFKNDKASKEYIKILEKVANY